nr:PREDICTED: DENN domain-containing protein 3-like [Equus przewalskii]
MFHSFLKARLSRRLDAFAQMDLSTQSEEDRINGMLLSPRRPTIEKMASRKASASHTTHRRMVVSMPNLQDIAPPELPPRNSSLRKVDTGDCRSSSTVLNVSPTTTYTFKLPEIHFPLVGQCVQAYYCDCVSLLSKAMSFLAPESSVLLARYFYLRGLVHLMQGQLLGALLDFQSLYKTDVRIFPADLVKRTVDSMSAPERAQAEQTPELRRLISEVMDKAGEAPKADDRVKNFELPKKHMQLDDFVKRVQESGIVKDIGTIHRLFEALTVGPRIRRVLWPHLVAQTARQTPGPHFGNAAFPHILSCRFRLLPTPPSSKGLLPPTRAFPSGHVYMHLLPIDMSKSGAWVLSVFKLCVSCVLLWVSVCAILLTLCCQDGPALVRSSPSLLALLLTALGREHLCAPRAGGPCVCLFECDMALCCLFLWVPMHRVLEDLRREACFGVQVPSSSLLAARGPGYTPASSLRVLGVTSVT